MIRIAKLERAARHAVERQQQLVAAREIRRAVLRPVRAHLLVQRVDVGRMIVEMLDQPQLRLVAHLAHHAEDLVERGGGGGAGILRIHRQHQDALHALLAQCLHHRGDRRVAVAHRAGHHHVVPLRIEQLLQGVRLALAVDQQRRARHVGLAQPDRLVLVRRGARAQRQDQHVEDEPPRRPRNLHHARVGQELAQVAADLARRGAVGRAEVDQQDRGAIGLAVLEQGFGQKWHGARLCG